MRQSIIAATALALFVALPAAGGPADANWLTHIVKEAGEAGGKAATHAHPNLGPVGRAVGHLDRLGAAPKGTLAAHATPEGHWQFANREGQTLTAGTADEFNRILPALAPDAPPGTKLSLYLSEDSVFANRAHLDKLPGDADLHVVTEHGAFALTRKAAEGGEALVARLKPNMTIELKDAAGFDEAVAYLARPLNGANIRTLAFEPGGAKYVSSSPKVEAGTKNALVDQLDPAHLASGFGSIRGQTVVVVGRVDEGKLISPTSSGSGVTLDLAQLRTAARDNDVNLIVLRSDAGRQPGGRNWLWQRIEVGGMSEAKEKASVGDFLDALAARRGGFMLNAEHTGQGRVQMAALPDPASGGVVKEASDLWSEVVSHVTGEVVTTAIDIDSRDSAQQMELDGRIIPGVPTYVQIPYLLSVFLGVLGWATLRGWWRRLWSPRPRSAGEGRAGYMLKRLPGEALFWLGFAPIAGGPAFIVQALVGFWNSVMAPFRWVRRKFLIREV
jgi:hypothetical protein